MKTIDLTPSSPHRFATLPKVLCTAAFCLVSSLFNPARMHAMMGAPADVSITANAPKYGFAPLSGEVLCFNVQVSGGTLNTVNWTVPRGGAVFLPSSGGTAASVTAGAPMQCIQITAAPGHLSVSGDGSALTSTQVVTVHAQSVDDPSKSVDTPFYIAADTTRVRIVGAFYQQVFLGQDATVTADVQGTSDQSGKWNIASSPSGSKPSLTDADKRTVTLHASTPGRYTLNFTATADPSKTGSAIVYMASATSSSVLSASTYIASQNKTKIVPCEVDPAFTTVYDIGPGKAYPDFVSTPDADTVAPGTIYRFFNTDRTGAVPTTLHNYFQVINSGTPTQPIYVCGVPDVYGNLPILDGNDAIGQAGVHQYGACYQYALLCFDAGGYSHGHLVGPYQADPVGPNYVAAAGIHIRNTRGRLFPPGAKSGAETAWGGSAACVAVQSGTQIDLEGLDIENCANGLYTTENQNNGFAATTLGVSLRYSHVHLFGNVGSGTEHAIYFQTFFGMVEGTLIDEPLVAGNVGSCIKWRGIDGIFRYNSCPAGVGRDFDGVEVQDDSAYVDLTRWIDNGNYASGDASADIIAGLQGTLFNGDWFYGNLIKQASGEALHYRADHDGLMAERLGQFYVYNNTVDQALTIFGVGDAQNGGSHYLDPVLHAFNNIFDNAGVTMINYAFGITDSLTNLYRAGSLYVPGPPTPVTSWYITPGGQGVFNSVNTLVNDSAAAVTFSGLSGNSGACLNGSLFTVQYGGGGNFQGPAGKCASTASADAPIAERSATATPHILGGYPNAGNAHGWSNQCYYACPWQLTGLIDAHQYGLSTANFRTTLTQPYDSVSFSAASVAYNAGSALPPAAAQLPVRFQFNPLTNAVEPRLQPLTIGARDVDSGASSFAVVAPTALASLSISPSIVTLAVNASQQLTATCTYSDGSATNCTSAVSWSSGNVSTLSVSATGLATGNAAGSAVVIASFAGQNASAAAAVGKAAATLGAITITPASVKVAKGSSQQLSAVCQYSDGSTTSCNNSVVWSNNGARAFTVTAGGLLTGSGAGSGSVTASLSGVTGTAAVSVTATVSLSSISIGPSASGLLKGSTRQLTATCNYSDGSTVNCSTTATWSNGGSAAFGVSPTGLITANAAGSGTVTAGFGGVTGSAPVMIVGPALSAISISPSTLGMMKNTTRQLTATCAYSDGSVVACTNTVTWSNGGSQLFSVSAFGLLTASLPGTGTVVASSNGVTATVPLTIVAPTLTSVSITPALVGISKGTTRQLAATCAYSDGSSVDCTNTVAWSNTGARAFTVSSSGLLNGVMAGSGIATASTGGMTGAALTSIFVMAR